MQPQLIEQSTLVLRGAIKNEIVDVVLRPFEGMSIPLSMFSLVISPEFKQPAANDPETFRLHNADQSLRWQDNHLGMITHETQTEYFLCEVARFCVPMGQVGFIEQVEQIVNDVAGAYFPTNQEYWGSPRFVFADVDNLRWFFKLDFYNGIQPPLFAASNTVPIPISTAPGYPYLDLPIVDALFYPCHNNRRVKLIVPGNRILRMFCYSPPTLVYQWEYGGRLAGYTQSTYHDEAKSNARLITC